MPKPKIKKPYRDLEKKLGYTFKNKVLLGNALNIQLPIFEQLCWMGGKVFSFYIAKFFHDYIADLPIQAAELESTYQEMLSHKENSLLEISNNLNLHNWFVANKNSFTDHELINAVEAIVGAISLEAPEKKLFQLFNKYFSLYLEPIILKNFPVLMTVKDISTESKTHAPLPKNENKSNADKSVSLFYMAASAKTTQEAEKYILEAKALDDTQINFVGRKYTPLMYAMKLKKHDNAELLVKHGAKWDQISGKQNKKRLKNVNDIVERHDLPPSLVSKIKNENLVIS